MTLQLVPRLVCFLISVLAVTVLGEGVLGAFVLSAKSISVNEHILVPKETVSE